MKSKSAKSLPDVNVLIALFDPAHPHHDVAHDWFHLHRSRGWATCPTTIHGMVRILSSHSYPNLKLRPNEAIAHLNELCTAADHEFWPDSVSILDDQLFDPNRIASSKHITDIVLLGLAVRRGASLVTFDTKIDKAAVIGAQPGCLHILKTIFTP